MSGPVLSGYVFHLDRYASMPVVLRPAIVGWYIEAEIRLIALGRLWHLCFNSVHAYA